MASLPMIMIEPAVRAALLEDLGRAGDLTTDAIVPAGAQTRCALVARQAGVVAGLDFAAAAFRLIDPAKRGWRWPTAAGCALVS
jgi:nicotinate-nucleotide pyrophosphorylase (carboxylating)